MRRVSTPSACGRSWKPRARRRTRGRDRRQAARGRRCAPRQADAPALPSNAGPTSTQRARKPARTPRARHGRRARGLGRLHGRGRVRGGAPTCAPRRSRRRPTSWGSATITPELQAVLREVVRLDPDNTWSHVALGDIATILNDSTQALHAFRTAEAAARRSAHTSDIGAASTESALSLSHRATLRAHYCTTTRRWRSLARWSAPIRANPTGSATYPSP